MGTGSDQLENRLQNTNQHSSALGGVLEGSLIPSLESHDGSQEQMAELVNQAGVVLWRGRKMALMSVFSSD